MRSIMAGPSIKETILISFWHFGQRSGSASQTFLMFEPKLEVYIKERQWHPSQVFETRADGRVEMRLETTGRKENWCTGFCPGFRTLKF
jgi:hypothetical protein